MNLETELKHIWNMQHSVINNQKEEFNGFEIDPANYPNINPSIATGWELEIEKYNTGLVNKYYPNKVFLLDEEDHSLKVQGLELITNGGLTEHRLFQSISELKYIISLLEHHNHPVDFTHRCSFHVHLDVSSYTADNLTTFVGAFMLVEPFLFSLCENHREGNNYCTSINNLALKQNNLFNINFHDSKYWSLSLNRLADLGTVEIRPHHGTANTHKLLTWIGYLHKIWDYAKEHTFDEFKWAVLDLQHYNQINTLSQQILGTDIMSDKLERKLKNSYINTLFYFNI